MRLLVVEDEPAIRSALTRGLAQNGVDVVAAGSLGEARDQVAKQPVDALLSDLKLPDGSGLDLACELGVPFLLMSGYASFDDAVQALRMGCVDFFTKPVPIRDLRRAVDRLQARIRVDAMAVVGPAPAGDHLEFIRPSALGMVRQTVTAQVLVWDGPETAKAAFAAHAPASGPVRQVLAELIQSTPRGRLVINAAANWWQAFLDAEIDWTGQEQERRALIEDLSERCVWRRDGALVECCDG